MIQPRMLWMFRPVDRSITVSAPQRVDHTSFSTSSATPDVTAELPILALIFTRKLRPMMTGSSSGWLMLAGMMARPRAISERTNSGVMNGGISAPKLSPSAIARLGLRQRLGAAEVFAVRDVDHFLGDDAGAGELVLRHQLARLAAIDGQFRGTGRDQLVVADIAVVLRLHRARRRSDRNRVWRAIRARTGGSPASRSIRAPVSV